MVQVAFGGKGARGLRWDTLDFSSVIATKTQFREQGIYISLRIGTRGVASSGMTNVAPSIRPKNRPFKACS